MALFKLSKTGSAGAAQGVDTGFYSHASWYIAVALMLKGLQSLFVYSNTSHFIHAIPQF